MKVHVISAYEPGKSQKACRSSRQGCGGLARGPELNYVSPVDVLVRIGCLDPGAVKRWRLGQVDYLERIIQTNLSRISEAMKLFRSWATAKGLIPSETSYVARTPSRQTLRFSKSGTLTIERLYRTHWLSGELSQRKQERRTRAVHRNCW